MRIEAEHCHRHPGEGQTQLRSGKMIEQRTAPYDTLLLRLTLGSLFTAHLYWNLAILPGGLEKWWSNFETSGYHWLVPW